VFHRFGKARFVYGGLVLSFSQFSLLPQMPSKMKLNSIEEAYFEYSNFEFKNGNFEKQSGELKLNTYPIYSSNKFPTIWQNLIGC